MRLLVFLAAALAASAAVDRPDLSGKWTLDATKGQAAGLKAGTLAIEDADSELRIREEFTLASGKTDDFDLRCNTMGKECSFKTGNEPVKVSIWHNGPKLVVMETRGKNADLVRKKTLVLSPDGATLTMEVLPITPMGEKQVLVFAKK